MRNTIKTFQRNVAHHSFSWRWDDLIALYAFVMVWVALVSFFPNSLWNPDTMEATVIIGVLGTWRYSWWLLNLTRAGIFGRIVFPKMRAKADKVWEDGWRPSHVHILMTTYYEYKFSTHKYLEAIVKEFQREGINGTLWVGLGSREDEEIIEEWMAAVNCPNLDVVLVRQQQSGKRMAIGVILRALSRRGVGENELAFLMDGDSIIDKGALRKCVSIFGAYPDMQALTTDEDAVVIGPKWVQSWLTMRFAQRRMWMQSHSLSKKILVLTGRMSVFRAERLIDPEMIGTVEKDFLNHWFWGTFRFLSGDDKSTWYTLLKQGARMTYVPDVMAYTIEHIEGNGINRMKENLLRWSGNMLRNGMRAIMLGPRKVGFHIWWCLIDQRISIWTVLIGWTTAITISIFVAPSFLITYFLWIALTRFIMSVSLFFYSNRIYMSYPFVLYASQLLSAFVKVYMLFRLPRQRWAKNRINNKGGQDAMANPWKRAFAVYAQALYTTAMLFFILLATGIFEWPYGFQLSNFLDMLY